jgi:hypothetical protein
MSILPYRHPRPEVPLMDTGNPTRLHMHLCPRKGCTFAASSRRDGLTVDSLAAHIVYAHMLPEHEAQGAA